jgi:hypothetical protein
MNQDASSLPTEAWGRLEEVLARFEDAWQRGERPALDDYPGAAGPAERLPLLIELVQEELEYRLKAGEPARVEDYLGRYPELAGDRGAALDLLAAEYEQRRRREAGLLPEEYARRFPGLGELLLQRLPAHRGPGPDLAEAPVSGPAPPTAVEEAASGGAAGGPPAVAGYEILCELGRGGMGVVYKGRHLKLNRLVALKMVLAGAHAGPDDLARFLAEAEAVAALQHPHIVQLYDFGQHGGLPFFALEFVLGSKRMGLARPPQADPCSAAWGVQLRAVPRP